jgi:hypothetical protein
MRKLIWFLVRMLFVASEALQMVGSRTNHLDLRSLVGSKTNHLDLRSLVTTKTFLQALD